MAPNTRQAGSRATAATHTSTSVLRPRTIHLRSCAAAAHATTMAATHATMMAATAAASAASADSTQRAAFGARQPTQFDADQAAQRHDAQYFNASHDKTLLKKCVSARLAAAVAASTR
jgi:hypothetical protein